MFNAVELRSAKKLETGILVHFVVKMFCILSSQVVVLTKRRNIKTVRLVVLVVK